MSSLVLFAADIVNLSPDENGLPGGETAKQFVNGLGYYALLFCLVGLVLSAGLWAIGAFSSNYTQSVNGKKGFLICAGAALVIGAAAQLVNYFQGVGEGAVE